MLKFYSFLFELPLKPSSYFLVPYCISNPKDRWWNFNLSSWSWWQNRWWLDKWQLCTYIVKFLIFLILKIEYWVSDSRFEIRSTFKFSSDDFKTSIPKYSDFATFNSLILCTVLYLYTAFTVIYATLDQLIPHRLYCTEL